MPVKQFIILLGGINKGRKTRVEKEITAMQKNQRE